MAIKSLFFNADSETNVDRIYDTSDWSDYFKGIVNDGVLMESETSLMVSTASGMNVVVKAGSAYIDGRKLILDEDTIYPIQASHPTYARVDAVVMAKDLTNRVMNIYVKTGTPSATPTYPALVNSVRLKEYLLATVTVPSGATSIGSSNIVDKRASDCGCVYGVNQTSKLLQERYETKGDSIGWYDNINVNKIVEAFFNGSQYQGYNFTNVGADAQLKLEIIGSFNLTSASQYDSVITGACFGFSIPVGTQKRVILDFSKSMINFTTDNNTNFFGLFNVSEGNGSSRSTAAIELHNVKINGTVNGLSTSRLDVFYGIHKITNANVRIVNNAGIDVIGVTTYTNMANDTSGNGIYENCHIEIINQGTGSQAHNIYGFKSRKEDKDTIIPHRFINCSVRLTAAANTYYTLIGFDGMGLYEGCTANLYNSGTESLAYTTGFDTMNGVNVSKYSVYTNCNAYVVGSAITLGYAGTGRYTNCLARVASNSAAGQYTAGYSILGEAVNCYGYARNAGAGSGYGFMMGLEQTSGALRLVNCTGVGYCSTYEKDNDTAYAAGISATLANTTQALVCIGCRVPSVALTSFVQKNSIRIAGATSGVAGYLAGNVLFTASIKHSGNNLTETGTIIMS